MSSRIRFNYMVSYMISYFQGYNQGGILMQYTYIYIYEEYTSLCVAFYSNRLFKSCYFSGIRKKN